MSDERAYPARPIVGVGTVIWKNGEVLLVKRGKAPGLGDWTIPGGAQELGETMEETAHREALEEAGCKVKNLKFLRVADELLFDAQDQLEYHYTLIDFEADWASGEPRPGEAETDAAFFDPARLDELQMWEETRKAIRQSLAGRTLR